MAYLLEGGGLSGGAGGLGQAVSLNPQPNVPKPTRSGSYATTTMRSSNNNAAAARRAAASSRLQSAPSGPPAGGPGPVPDINSFLSGDAGYQDQLKQFANALALFNADVGRRRGSLETDYASSQKAMNDQKLIDLNNLEADYGARGVLRSGLYGKAVGDYNNEFNTRMTDLTTKEKDALAGLDQESTRYKSQQDLQTQAAREAAIRRRAEQYGI